MYARDDRVGLILSNFSMFYLFFFSFSFESLRYMHEGCCMKDKEMICSISKTGKLHLAFCEMQNSGCNELETCIACIIYLPLWRYLIPLVGFDKSTHGLELNTALRDFMISHPLYFVCGFLGQRLVQWGTLLARFPTMPQGFIYFCCFSILLDRVRLYYLGITHSIWYSCLPLQWPDVYFGFSFSLVYVYIYGQDCGLYYFGLWQFFLIGSVYDVLNELRRSLIRCSKNPT